MEFQPVILCITEAGIWFKFPARKTLITMRKRELIRRTMTQKKSGDSDSRKNSGKNFADKRKDHSGKKDSRKDSRKWAKNNGKGSSRKDVSAKNGSRKMERSLSRKND